MKQAFRRRLVSEMLGLRYTLIVVTPLVSLGIDVLVALCKARPGKLRADAGRQEALCGLDLINLIRSAQIR